MTSLKLGDDSTATDTNQYARFNSGIAENAGDMERPLGYAGGAVEGADGSRGADGTDPDGVSGDASGASGTDSDGDLDLDGELPITGCESERELFTATLLGGTDGETEFEETDYVYNTRVRITGNNCSASGSNEVIVRFFAEFESDTIAEEKTAPRI